MGFRLNIKTMNEKKFGDDHKLYGYWPFDAIKGSFSVIFPLIKEQWPVIGDTPEEVYENHFMFGEATDELVISNDIFKEFAKEYIADLITTNHDPELVGYVSVYLTKLCNKYPGNKILYWN